MYWGHQLQQWHYPMVLLQELGANIHKAGASNFTGTFWQTIEGVLTYSGVTEGCVTIDINKWSDFYSNFTFAGDVGTIIYRDEAPVISVADDGDIKTIIMNFYLECLNFHEEMVNTLIDNIFDGGIYNQGIQKIVDSHIKQVEYCIIEGEISKLKK
jgi:hypothetical protein